MAHDRSRTLAIVNPASGNADPTSVEEHLIDALGAVELRHTPAHADLVAFVREQLDEVRPERVVVSGGDGTVSAVASALVGAATPLGILPTGTANVLARELGIPSELSAACAMIAAGHTRSIDAMSIGARRCLCRLGFGQLAQVGLATSAEDKQASKGLAYVRSAVPCILDTVELELELEIDGVAVQIRGSSVVVTSVNSVGLAGLAWHEAVSPDDGVIDVIVVEAASVMDHLGLLWNAIAGTAAEANITQHFRAQRSVSIRSQAELPAVADGEPLTGNAHRIDVMSRSVHVFAPSPVQAHYEPITGEMPPPSSPSLRTA